MWKQTFMRMRPILQAAVRDSATVKQLSRTWFPETPSSTTALAKYSSVTAAVSRARMVAADFTKSETRMKEMHAEWVKAQYGKSAPDTVAIEFLEAFFERCPDFAKYGFSAGAYLVAKVEEMAPAEPGLECDFMSVSQDYATVASDGTPKEFPAGSGPAGTVPRGGVVDSLGQARQAQEDLVDYMEKTFGRSPANSLLKAVWDHLFGALRDVIESQELRFVLAAVNYGESGDPQPESARIDFLAADQEYTFRYDGNPFAESDTRPPDVLGGPAPVPGRSVPRERPVGAKAPAVEVDQVQEAGAPSPAAGGEQADPLEAGGVPRADAPEILAIAPTTGPRAGGTAVVISGRNLLGAVVATFGGVDVDVVVDGSSLRATTPPGPEGDVEVTVSTPARRSRPLTFTYV